MKHTKWLLGLSLLVVLALSLSACAGSSKATRTPEEPDTAPQEDGSLASSEPPASTDTSSPTGSPGSGVSSEQKGLQAGSGEELDISALAPASDLASYRSATTILAEGLDNGQTIQGTIEFLIEYTREPLAQHTVISSQGFEDSEEALDTEIFILEDTTYMKLDGEWFSTPADGAMPVDDTGFVTSASMLGDTCGWRRQGTLERNGIDVHHWTLSYSDFAECITPEALAQMGEIRDASGNLFVTVDSNHVLYLDLVFEGQGLAMGVGSAEDRVEDGRVEFAFEMTAIDQPFDIQIPEEALASNAMPEDIPIPDGAEQLTNMFGMVTFLSAGTPEEVADYFATEMAGHSWNQVSAEQYGGTFMLEYAKGVRTASLMIGTDPDANKTSVLITVEGE